MAEAFIGEIRAVAFNYAPEGWQICDGRELQISQYVGLYTLLGNNFGGKQPYTFALPDLRGSVAIGFGTGKYPGASPYNLGTKGGTEQNLLNTYQVPIAVHSHAAKFVDPEFVVTSTDPVYTANVSEAKYSASISGTVTPKARVSGGGALDNTPSGNVMAVSGTANIYSPLSNGKMAPAEVDLKVSIATETPASTEIVNKTSGSVTIAKRTSGSVTIENTSPGVALQNVENRMPFLAVNYIICCVGLFPVRP